MLAILLLILVVLPLSFCQPICQDPPPPASYIPNSTDCHYLVGTIFAIAKLQDDEPISWSRSPSALVRNRKLPYSFRESIPSSDCEFIVDALYEESQDTFPTRVVAEKAEELVQKCIEQGIDGAQTVGAVAVGPKHVIAVILKKTWWIRSSESGGIHELNMTDVTLLGPGNIL